MPQRLTVAIWIGVALACTGLCQAQSIQERIERVRQRQVAQREDATYEAQVDLPNIQYLLRTVIDDVRIEQATAREAFSWWSATTGISLVINWEAMAFDGVDPEQPVSLQLSYVPAGHLLRIIMQMASPDAELIFQPTAWYVQVMTKREANRQPVLRIYDVTDLVVTIPSFTNAPSFDLREALSNTNSGGGNSGGNSSLFADRDSDGANEFKSKTQRGDELADTIRQTIEPNIWQANGGEYASVRYFNGRLIVSAPLYVHRQIGRPIPPPRPMVFNPERELQTGPRAPSNGVSGIKPAMKNISSTRRTR